MGLQAFCVLKPPFSKKTRPNRTGRSSQGIVMLEYILQADSICEYCCRLAVSCHFPCRSASSTTIAPKMLNVWVKRIQGIAMLTYSGSMPIHLIAIHLLSSFSWLNGQ
mmetsp:Transcript_9564/g.17389  ORF Transcript_9564/g.17389 Transcript_9564/m.17389 type:complete len:108 (+) Transcript_9564:519-842(+)